MESELILQFFTSLVGAGGLYDIGEKMLRRNSTLSAPKGFVATLCFSCLFIVPWLIPPAIRILEKKPEETKNEL